MATGARAKLNRALRLRGEFQRLERDFLTANIFQDCEEGPSVLPPAADDDLSDLERAGYSLARVRQHKVKLRGEVPIEASCITSDILANLRSALDVSICELSLARGVSEIDLAEKRYEFPISLRDEPSLRRRESFKQLDPDIQAEILLAHPWSVATGGSRGLAILNEVRNHHVHRLVVGVCARVDLRAVRSQVRDAAHFLLAGGAWNFEKQEALLFETSLRADVESNFSLRAELCFGPVPEVAREAVLRTLDELHREVSGIVGRIEKLRRP